MCSVPEIYNTLNVHYPVPAGHVGGVEPGDAPVRPDGHLGPHAPDCTDCTGLHPTKPTLGLAVLGAQVGEQLLGQVTGPIEARGERGPGGQAVKDRREQVKLLGDPTPATSIRNSCRKVQHSTQWQ